MRGDEQPLRGRVLYHKNQGRPAAAPGGAEARSNLAAPGAISRSSAALCPGPDHGRHGRGRLQNEKRGDERVDAAEEEVDARRGGHPGVAALPEGLARQVG